MSRSRLSTTTAPTAAERGAARRALGLYDGASSTPTAAALSKAYKRAALLAHPDKGGSAAQFQRISDAYALLSAARDDVGGGGGDDEAPPERLLRYRVSGRNGALVRRGVALDSEVVGSLGHGDLATVFESEGRAETAAAGDKVRLRVAYPLSGWVSASTVQEELDFLNREPATLRAAIRRAGKGAAPPAAGASFKDFLAAGARRRRFFFF